MNVERYLGALIAKGGSGSRLSGFPEDLIQGGGRAIRHLVALYQRVYHNHLAQLSQQGHLLPFTDAGRFEYKDYVEVLEPYDVRGQRFMIYRYDNPRQPTMPGASCPSCVRSAGCPPMNGMIPWPEQK